MLSDLALASICHDLESGRPTREELVTLLRSGDEAVVHATVLHLDKRLRDGDPIDAWPAMLPDDVFLLPPESQLVLASLSLDGFSLEAPDPPGTLPPSVRLAWLRAATLLNRPDALMGLHGNPMGWNAVANLPTERVVAGGLLDRIVASTDAAIREASIGYLRESLKCGFLSRVEAHDHAIRLAQDPATPIAIAALRFLAEPWTFSMSLPQLRARPDDVDVEREIAHLLGARRDVHQIRKRLAEARSAGASPYYMGDLITALGESGGAVDVPLILEHIGDDPHAFGLPGLKALVTLKRRGISPEDDDARALLAFYLDGPGWDPSAAAEVMSSRADLVVDAIDALLTEEPQWSRVVALLESLGTRRAIRRLRRIIERIEERSGWWYAIRALGRLGVTDAEVEILARLDDEPDSCLYALRFIGGDQAVCALAKRVSADDLTPPVWLGADRAGAVGAHALSGDNVTSRTCPTADAVADGRGSRSRQGRASA